MPDQKISADPLISSLDGTEYFPLIQDGVNVRMLVSTIIALASGGNEITNSTTISRLKNPSNWDAVQGGTYTGPTISEAEHNYLVANSTDGPLYKYVMLKIATVLQPVRILITPY